MHFLLDCPYYQNIRNRAQVEKSKFIEHGRQSRNIDGKNIGGIIRNRDGRQIRNIQNEKYFERDVASKIRAKILKEVKDKIRR